MTTPLFWACGGLFLLLTSVHLYDVWYGQWRAIILMGGVLHILNLLLANSILPALFKPWPKVKRGFLFLGFAVLVLAALFALFFLKRIIPGVFTLFYASITFPVPKLFGSGNYYSLALQILIALFYWFWAGEAFSRLSNFRFKEKQKVKKSADVLGYIPVGFKVSLVLSSLAAVAALACQLITWVDAEKFPGLIGTVEIAAIVCAFFLPFCQFMKGQLAQKLQQKRFKPESGPALRVVTYVSVFYALGNMALFFAWPLLAKELRITGYLQQPPDHIMARGWISIIFFAAFIMARQTYLEILQLEGKAVERLSSGRRGGSSPALSYAEALKILDREGRLDLHLRWDYRVNLLGGHVILRFVLGTLVPAIILNALLSNALRIPDAWPYPVALAGVLFLYHLIRIFPLLLGCLGFRPVMNLAPEGLWVSGRGRLPWRDLKSIQVAHKMQERVLKFIPQNGDFLNEVPWWAKWDARLFFKSTGLYERFGMAAFDLDCKDLVKLLQEKYEVKMDKPSVEIMNSATAENQAGDSKEDILAIRDLRRLAEGRPSPEPKNLPETKPGKVGAFVGGAFGVYFKLILFGLAFGVIFNMLGLDKILHFSLIQWVSYGFIGIFIFFFGFNGFGLAWAAWKGWSGRDREGSLGRGQKIGLVFMVLLAAGFLYGFFAFALSFFRK